MSSRRPVRLAILGTRGIPARYGGFETFAEEISIRLVQRGIDVTVYCEAGEGTLPAEHRGVRLVHVSAVRLGPLTTILFDLRCLWHARRGHDVVYMLGYGAAPFCMLPRLWGSTVWLNVDGVEWARAKWGRVARFYFKLMEAFSMWSPSRVIADAEAIRDHLLARHRSPRPISVIAYGATLVEDAPDPSPLSEWGLRPDEFFLIVCRLEPENHVLEMLRGFAASGSRRALVVVGNHRMDTPYVRELLTVQDPRIHFVGTVYDQVKLRALRHHAFAYCHGHSVGGTNPSLLEALGCGNAVLAHDNAFNREVARDAAVYFASPEDFTKRLAALESSLEARAAMRRRAHEILRACYTWERIAEQYLELLEAGDR
jgi:glycosyltransferase involved in cell wall biosynthesis